MEKERKFNWSTLSAIILGILLISVTIFAVNGETQKIKEEGPEVIYVGHDDEEPLENFSREGAVEAMIDVLNSVDKDIEGQDRTVEDRMKVLDDEEADMEDAINQETVDKLYLQEEFKNDKFNRQFTASALLTYRELVREITQEDEVRALIDVYDELVYLDEKLMVAHIPIDVFIGDNRGLAFEMQYIDGEWKFNPYTSMMSLVMIVNYENQIENVLRMQDNASSSEDE